MPHPAPGLLFELHEALATFAARAPRDLASECVGQTLRDATALVAALRQWRAAIGFAIEGAAAENLDDVSKLLAPFMLIEFDASRDAPLIASLIAESTHALVSLSDVTSLPLRAVCERVITAQVLGALHYGFAGGWQDTEEAGAPGPLAVPAEVWAVLAGAADDLDGAAAVVGRWIPAPASPLRVTPGASLPLDILATWLHARGRLPQGSGANAENSDLMRSMFESMA